MTQPAAQPVADLEAAFAEKSRLKLLLDHFARIEDPREPWRVRHRLEEILLLVVCGTIADCDSYDAIALWGKANLAFLRRLLPYEHGVPGGRWLEIFMNRIDPALFSAAFADWVRATWPEGPHGRPDLVAIDGKTSRGSRDRVAGAPPLHLVSAYATTAGLVLAQEAVAEKSNEITAIPILLARLALEGAVVTIDAMGCQKEIAAQIVDHGADYVLALKGNQGSLRDDVALFCAEQKARDFKDVKVISRRQTVEKGHGRIETRTVTAIGDIAWLAERHPEWKGLQSIVMVESVREIVGGNTETETRLYISSLPADAERQGAAIRGHWGIEALHWVLDVTYKEDQSRLRKGHGAHNMAIVRHFAFNLVRAMKDKKSLKLRRKLAGWSADYLAEILGHSLR